MRRTLGRPTAEAVARITLNRPERANALNGTMLGEIGAALDDAEQDTTVRAIIVQGAGAAFSSGFDLKEQMQRQPMGIAEWEPIQARLMALSSFNERVRSLQRLLVGHADDVELDGAGRILVPPALRQYAALDKHVVLVGQGNKFELWDDARWTEQTARAIVFPAGGLPPELDGFSL